MQELQPWGDSAATPEVELAFVWQDTPWQLNKSFLKEKRCDLRIGSEQFSGDEAEDKLAALLGYQFAGRGVSKPEHHGIPGLLWVEQGAIQGIRDPVSHVGDHLQSALDARLGEVSSSSGDGLIADVEKLRGQLQTATGKPAAEYRKTIQQCADQQARLQDLAQAIGDYEQQIDELGRLRQQQQAENAKTQLAEVQSWQEQQQTDAQALADCRQHCFRKRI